MNENINENEMIPEKDAEAEITVDKSAPETDDEANAAKTDAAAENDDNASCGGSEDEISDVNEPELSDDDCRRILSDARFFEFSKGKDGRIEDLIREFSKTFNINAGEAKVMPADLVTPSHGVASPDYALSERQRRIARSAGMSYREYYGFLKTMK